MEIGNSKRTYPQYGKYWKRAVLWSKYPQCDWFLWGLHGMPQNLILLLWGLFGIMYHVSGLTS